MSKCKDCRSIITFCFLKPQMQPLFPGKTRNLVLFFSTRKYGVFLQVPYIVSKHGSPVLVTCRAQTYNVTIPSSVVPVNPTASVSPFNPLEKSLENVDRLQYLYNTSEGKSHIST